MATALSGLLVLNVREALVDGTGESREIDFNIARGQAIGIDKIILEGVIPAHDGANIELGTIISIDGPNFANNSLVTKALFEAQEVLDSSIAQLHMGIDITTTGASQVDRQIIIPFTEPIFTARNLGFAGLAEGASGEIFAHIYYKYYDITAQEFVVLFTDQRA